MSKLNIGQWLLLLGFIAPLFMLFWAAIGGGIIQIVLWIDKSVRKHKEDIKDVDKC